MRSYQEEECPLDLLGELLFDQPWVGSQDLLWFGFYEDGYFRELNDAGWIPAMLGLGMRVCLVGYD